VTRFAEGGIVRPSIGHDDDSVPAFLSPSHVVVPDGVRRRIGDDLLERINGAPTVVVSAEDLLAEE